jgi:hypothetical protein
MTPENLQGRWAGSGSDFLYPNPTYALGGNFDLSSCLGGEINDVGGLPWKPIVHHDFDGAPVTQMGYFDTGSGWQGLVGGAKGVAPVNLA